jgi:hypothetical protein
MRVSKRVQTGKVGAAQILPWVAANATCRFLRGQNKRKNTDTMQRALRRGRARVMLERV